MVKMQDNFIVNYQGLMRIFNVTFTLLLLGNMSLFQASTSAQTMPTLVFETEENPVTSIFMSEFKRAGFDVFSKLEHRKIKASKASSLQHTAEETEEILKENLDESDGRSSYGTRKILNEMASAGSNYLYKVNMNYEIKQIEVNPENGFHEVNFLLNNITLINIKNQESLFKETGKQTGLGPDNTKAELNGAKRLARKIARAAALKVSKQMAASQTGDKVFRLTITKILDSKTFYVISKKITELVGIEPDKSFDEKHLTAKFSFMLASGGVTTFIEDLTENMSSVDEIEGLNVLNEQSGLKAVNVTAELEYP
jgi:hypothetical protein